MSLRSLVIPEDILSFRNQWDSECADQTVRICILSGSLLCICLIIEPAHDKTNKMACAPRAYAQSDQSLLLSLSLECSLRLKGRVWGDLTILLRKQSKQCIAIL